MGEALTGAALLAAEAVGGIGLALLGALVARARHRRRQRHRLVASWQTTKQHQVSGQAWTLAWQAHVRLLHLEDRVAALEADHRAPTNRSSGGDSL